MKRPGVTGRRRNYGDDLAAYLNLFKGPTSDLVIKALVALSGLDGPAMLRQIITQCFLAPL